MDSATGGRPLNTSLCEPRPNHSPAPADAHMALGIMLKEQGNLTGAEANFRCALTAGADATTALYQLGAVLQRQRKLAEAAHCFIKLIQLRFADVWNGAAPPVVRMAQARLDKLIDACQQEARNQPGCADSHCRLGGVLLLQGRQAEALECLRRAVALRPDWTEALVNLGAALFYAGQLDEARACYERAIAIEPENANAHFHLGLLLLLQGHLERGWTEYEWRWRSKELRHTLGVKSHSLQPVWRGEHLDGKTILLHAEQGVGDTLQFVRYAPLVADRGGRVIVGCQPELKRLLQGLAGVAEVKASGEPIVMPHDMRHAALLSLPMIFGTTLETVPQPGPYLHADGALSAAWAGQLAGERRFKVGLVWAGGPHNQTNGLRSIHPVLLKPLGEVPAITFYALQKHFANAHPAPFVPSGVGTSLTDVAPQLTDFADTAALVSQLDLVITVDTAVAHLAGALGRPVWILLSYVPDWRWLLEREDSPWYPTARLFRQPRLGDWESVVARVASALREVAAASAAGRPHAAMALRR